MGQSLVEAVFNVGKSPPLLHEIKKECYEIGNENKICRIGQPDRCGSTGCEWKKVFGYFCSNTVRVDNEVEKYKNKEAIKTLEKNKIKTNKKLTEEKNFIEKIQEAHGCSRSKNIILAISSVG